MTPCVRQGVVYDFPGIGSSLKHVKDVNGQLPYTRVDMQRLVAYAAQRSIAIVPEFDIPAHAHGLSHTTGGATTTAACDV